MVVTDQAMTLDAAIRDLREVARIVADSFGPFGLDALVSSAGGQNVATNDGERILEALLPRVCLGPAYLALCGALRFGARCGDASSSLILMLSAGFEAALGGSAARLSGEACGNHSEVWWARGTAGSGGFARSRGSELGMPGVRRVVEGSGRDAVLARVRAVQGVKSWLLTSALPEIVAKRQVSCDRRMREVAMAVLHTSVAGRLSRNLGAHLVGLVAELVDDALFGGTDACGGREAMDALVRNVPLLCVAGAQTASSHVVEGVIVPQPFCDARGFKDLQPASVLVFRCSIEGPSGMPAEVAVRTVDELKSALEDREASIRRKVSSLVEIGVDVVLTTERVSDGAQVVFAESGVAVVQLVPEHVVDEIWRATGCCPLTDSLTRTIAGAVPTTFARCTELRIGKTRVVQLSVSGLKTLVLRAPCDALCHVYKRMVTRALKLLTAALTASDGTWEVVPGGVCVNFALMAAIADAMESVKKGMMESFEGAGLTPSLALLGLSILREMALAAPTALIKTGWPAGQVGGSRLVTQVVHEVVERQRTGEVTCGLVCKAAAPPTPARVCAPGQRVAASTVSAAPDAQIQNEGESDGSKGDCDVWGMEVADAMRHKVLEPAALHVSLWENGLALLLQMLRVDTVVAAKVPCPTCRSDV